MVTAMDQQKLHRSRGGTQVITTFTAPEPLVRDLRATAAERGISISALIREAVTAYGISPQQR